jgi:hypothetical protein
MDERLERAAAKVEIAELQSRYEWAVDEGRIELLKPLFDEDACLTLAPAGVDCRGRSAILAWFRQYCTEWGWQNRRHYLTNMQVLPDADRARFRAYFLLTFEAHGRSRIAWGNYDDRLERRGDVWVITEKHITGAGPFSLEKGWAGARLEPSAHDWP